MSLPEDLRKMAEEKRTRLGITRSLYVQQLIRRNLGLPTVVNLADDPPKIDFGNGYA